MTEKPVFNVMAMLSLLGDSCIAVTGTCLIALKNDCSVDDQPPLPPKLDSQVPVTWVDTRRL